MVYHVFVFVSSRQVCFFPCDTDTDTVTDTEPCSECEEPFPNNLKTFGPRCTVRYRTGRIIEVVWVYSLSILVLKEMSISSFEGFRKEPRKNYIKV